jgi:hypothetical protein
VIDPDHVQYCGGLPLEEQAQIIARATGGRGPNRDYLWSTAAHLAELGLFGIPWPEDDHERCLSRLMYAWDDRWLAATIVDGRVAFAR